MRSLYHLDSYKREYIELKWYKVNPEGDLQISCTLREIWWARMSEKFTVEQKIQIVIESFTASITGLSQPVYAQIELTLEND